MTNETTASQPKSIGDDAQFLTLMDAALKEYWEPERHVKALAAYIDNFRAPAAQASAEVVRNNVPGSPHNVCRTTEHNLRKRIAELEAQASATIQAAPELLNTERLGLLISYVSVANRRDGWAAENSYFGSEDLARAAKAVENAERNLLEYVKSISATIQEPVMVSEPVGAVLDENSGIATLLQSYKEGRNTAEHTLLMIETLLSAAPMVADPAGVAAGANLYRKTALVSAEQFLPAEGIIPDGVISDGMGDPRKDSSYTFVLDTKEGRHVMRAGDYVCTGVEGEKWNVEQSIFEKTYELAATVKAVPSEALAAIHGLISVAGAAYHLMDNTEESGPVGASMFKHQEDDNMYLSEALDQLDALPDDQPGYVMGPCAKAEWALRHILAAPLADKTGGGE